MAAYAYTVTLAQPTVHKLGKLGVLRGIVDVTNYNATKAQITEITSRFKGDPTVLLGGVSSTGRLVEWDETAKSVKAFDPGSATGTEVATDVNVGSVAFVAFGVAP